MICFNDIKNSAEIKTYIQKGDCAMKAIGYTEHGFAHAAKVSYDAGRILSLLNYEQRIVELSKIAGYMHDIGNCINRFDHAQSGAVMAFRILDRMGMEPEELADIVGAIGNHDEGTGFPINPISAALILADKSDVRRTRVRNELMIASDIHDRVNFTVFESKLILLPEQQKILLDLKIDTKIGAVMDYFEIFLSRMMMCRRAAEYLNQVFTLNINDVSLL